MKTPIYTLLNGKFRDKIPIASEIGINDPDSMAENALRVLDLGIPVIKIKSSREYQKDIQIIKKEKYKYSFDSRWIYLGS